MIKIDLHIHSRCSDGTYSPPDLVKEAKKRGISVLSLTDHDTVEGTSAFFAACRKYNIKCISGVELSAQYPGTLHILGYRIDHKHEGFNRALEEIRKHRNSRNLKIHKKLNEAGIKIDLDEIRAEAGGSVLARPHFARTIVRNGYAKDIPSAFSKYLSRGALAYEPGLRLEPQKCISLILEAGGLPVLAHPSQTTRDENVLDKLLLEMRSMGLWGMECIYPSHTPEEMFRCMKLASKHSLCFTAGSDFHGENRQSKGMGIAVREDFLPWARLGISL